MRLTSLFLVSLNCYSSEQTSITSPDTQEFFPAAQQFKHMKTNTGILVDEKNIQNSQILKNKILSIYFKYHGNRSVCENEPYIDEISVGDCSGVLVKSDIVATAAHCVDENIFEKTWYFNYQQGQNLIHKKGYKVKRIIYKNFNMIKSSFSPALKAINQQRADKYMRPLPPDQYDYSTYRDIALLKLSDNVHGFSPVSVNFSPFEEGKKAISIGYPLGTSLKYGVSGTLTSEGNAYYMASTITSFKGNSGGPLYDIETGELLGITVNKGRLESFNLKPKKGCYGFDGQQSNEMLNNRYNLQYLSGHMNFKLLQPLID